MQSFRSHTFNYLVIAGLIFAASNLNQNLFAGTVLPGVQEQEDDVDVEALLNDGRSKVQAGDFAGAAVILRKVTEADDQQGLAWQLLGYSLHLDGKLDEAIVAHTKAATFDDYKGIALYNLACAWSLKKETEKAMEFFEQAVEAGYDGMNVIDNDSDLDNIRSHSRFDSIVNWALTGKRPVAEDNELVGTWTPVTGERAGEKVADERLGGEIEFTDKQITIPAPGADEGFVMNYTVDASKKPVEIDIEIESGPAPEGKAIGIIKVEDGKMTLCYDPTGATRPEKFETSADDGFFLFECKKAEAAFDAAAIQGEWVFVSGVRGGAEVGEDRLAGTVTIDAEKITMPAGDDAFVMGYTIDASTTPATIDMKVLSGPAPEGSPAFGIIKQNGKNILLCYNAMGEDRPTTFESTADNNFFLFTLGPGK